MTDPRENQQDAQLSETVRLDPEDAGTPIADSEHAAGYPDSESGELDDGDETGPDARTGSDHTNRPEERHDDGLPPSD